MDPDSLILPAFILSIVGLGVAVLAAMTGVFALVWQIRTRNLGAHRIEVVAISKTQYFDSERGKDDGESYVEIRVMNRGLTPVQVQNWAIVFGDGAAIVNLFPQPFPPQPQLPCLLAPGTSISFYSRADDIADSLEGRDLRRARPAVALATGERILGRRGQIAVS